jgi:hypothetical protein
MIAESGEGGKPFDSGQGGLGERLSFAFFCEALRRKVWLRWRKLLTKLLFPAKNFCVDEISNSQFRPFGA